MSTEAKTSSQDLPLMAVCPSRHDLLFCGSQPISLGGPLLDTSVLTGEAVATPNQDIKKRG